MVNLEKVVTDIASHMAPTKTTPMVPSNELAIVASNQPAGFIVFAKTEVKSTKERNVRRLLASSTSSLMPSALNVTSPKEDSKAQATDPSKVRHKHASCQWFSTT